MGTRALNEKQQAAADQLTGAIDAVVKSGRYASAKIVVTRPLGTAFQWMPKG